MTSHDEQPFHYPSQTRSYRRELRKNATHAERELWQGLRNRNCGGYKFRRQHGLGPFIVDFYCPEFRLAVEVDGSVHDSPERQRYDVDRTRYLAREGVTVIRFTNAEVLSSVDQCMRSILGTIAELEGRGEP
ncbi:MAG: endonuclease domain-containing protein [Bacteroidetes bacterium]|nr:endonuclease domain-containing protein [Bacteroidota bacterium]